MAKSYNPFDWYWLKPDGVTLYKSKSQSYVTASDADYKAWSADGTAPTLWAKDTAGAQTDTAMQAVLSTLVPPLSLPGLAPTAAALIAYANAKQTSLVMGGFTATIGGRAVPFATTTAGLTMVNGKVARLGQAGPPATVNWQTGPTTFVSIAAADFLAAAVKIGDFVQATFDALPAIFSAISGGTITTTAQIDAAAWPSNVG